MGGLLAPSVQDPTEALQGLTCMAKAPLMAVTWAGGIDLAEVSSMRPHLAPTTTASLAATTAWTSTQETTGASPKNQRASSRDTRTQVTQISTCMNPRLTRVLARHLLKTGPQLVRRRRGAGT